MNFEFKCPLGKSNFKYRSVSGWKSRLDDDCIPIEYHQYLDEGISACENITQLAKLEEVLKISAYQCKSQRDFRGFRRPERSQELIHLLKERRNTRHLETRKILSKRISKLIRRELRIWRSKWTDHLLTTFSNLKFIKKINTAPVQNQACPIEGEQFADFLSTLFSDTSNQCVIQADFSLLALIPKILSLIHI